MSRIDTSTDIGAAIDSAGRPSIPRDRWGRPLVVPPGGGKPIGYTRCTTFIDVLEDRYRLELWKQRMTALGLADRPDLLLAVAAHRADKPALNKLVAQAMEAAQASAPATIGTATHALAEQLDRGQTLGVIPPEVRADLDAYQAATAELEMVEIEAFGVCDELQVAGTCDRVVRWYGQYLLADIKTGSIEFGGLKIAQQLAVYAHCVPYDPDTGRHPRPYPIDTSTGLVIHLPAGTGTCTVLEVNIDLGWDAVHVSKQVRAWRAVGNWFTPLTVPNRPATLAEQIAAAPSIEVLRALWTNAVADETWTDEHLTLALHRKTELTNQKGHAA